MTTARNDRFLFWPPFLAIALSTTFIRVSSAPEIFNLDAVLIVFFWLTSVSVGIIICVAAILDRAWLRLLSAMTLPLSLAVWVLTRGYISDLDSILILGCQLMLVGGCVIGCIAAIIERAWLRLLSAMILPLGILVWAFVQGY